MFDAVDPRFRDSCNSKLATVIGKYGRSRIVPDAFDADNNQSALPLEINYGPRVS